VLIVFVFGERLLAKKRVETFEFPPNIRRETTRLNRIKTHELVNP
jgi:hypothetical protein